MDFLFDLFVFVEDCIGLCEQLLVDGCWYDFVVCMCEQCCVECCFEVLQLLCDVVLCEIECVGGCVQVVVFDDGLEDVELGQCECYGKQ